MLGVVGFRFKPSDYELINHYIRHKNAGRDSLVDNGISVVNICAHEPSELPALSKMNPEDDRVWYFFSLPEPKYPNSQTNKTARNCGSRELTRKNRETAIMNRSTKRGSWKPTGKNRVIREDGKVIGSKKTLVFYQRNQGKLQRTNWVMQEYRAAISFPTGIDYVVCKVKIKDDENTFDSLNSFASDYANLPSASNIKLEVNHVLREGLSNKENMVTKNDKRSMDEEDEPAKIVNENHQKKNKGKLPLGLHNN